MDTFNNLTEQARGLRAKIMSQDVIGSIAFVVMAQADILDDVTITEHADLFVIWDTNWTGKRGTIVQDEGKLYKSIHDVTNVGQNTKPSKTPTMWTPIGNPGEEWPEWVQPLGGHDAYGEGDKVSHKNKHWTSTVLNNIWKPGVYGWKES